MWVFGVVDGVPDTAFVDIGVRLNGDGTDINGAPVDSATLDSAGAATLTVIATDGLDVAPGEGVHVFPADSVVAYSFALQAGYVDLVVVRNDTGTTATGALTMSRSHVLEGATRPDYLLNPDIADIRNRYRELLVAADKRVAYASLLTRHSGMSAQTSEAYSDWVFMVADRLAFDGSRADSTELRALDDALAGTFFFTSQCGDSLVYGVGSEPSCGLVALRRAETTVASIGSDSGLSHVVYVNGINNMRDSAEQTFSRLRSIVLQTSFAARSKPYLFYNPTFREQQKGWNTQDRACAAYVRHRRSIYPTPLLALADMADCVGKQLIRNLIEHDLVEAAYQMLETQFGIFTAAPEVVDELAAHVTPLLNGGRSMIFVAHSQGNLVVNQALTRVAWDGMPLTDKPDYCIALLSLATPMNPSNFAVRPEYRFELTVDYDILRQLGMEYGVLSLQTPLSQLADVALANISGQPDSVAVAREWGERVHNASANYFSPINSVTAVKNRLEMLRSKCYE